jgi:LAO/AO transport system kinase
MPVNNKRGLVTRKRLLNKDEYVKGVLEGNKTVLARAITLIESKNPKDFALAQEVLNEILPFSGNSKRIGISGTPGVGKSTFIESYGTYLTSQGLQVAVLAVDPTSNITGGSILGDKTRMQTLASDDKAFIRPSPSGGSLGGVARRTRESILLCEAAGYDVVLVETVGVGQSEILVSEMVDFFLLLLQPGAGDDLQGIKRGILEVADLVAVNKADGDNLTKAEMAKHEYTGALNILRHESDWKPEVVLTSAVEKTGLSDVWDSTNKFFSDMSEAIQSKRDRQQLKWFWGLVEEKVINKIKSDKTLGPELKNFKGK